MSGAGLGKQLRWGWVAGPGPSVRLQGSPKPSGLHQWQVGQVGRVGHMGPEQEQPKF